MFYVYSQSFDLLPKKDCTYVSCSRVLLLTSNKDENFFFFFNLSDLENSLWGVHHCLSTLDDITFHNHCCLEKRPALTRRECLALVVIGSQFSFAPPPSLPNFSVSSPCWRCHHQCCNKAKAENAFSKSLVTVMTSHSALNTLCS